MIKKLLVGTLAGSVAGSLVSMVIFMGLFGSTGEQWLQENATCVKQMNEMPVLAWIFAILAQGFLLTAILLRFGVNNFKSGAIKGTWITFLMVFWYALWTYSTFKSYEIGWLPIDVLGNTLAGTVAGGVIGWLLGKVK